MVLVGTASKGFLGMAVTVKVLVETEPGREVPRSIKKLVIAPSVAVVSGDWDSVWIYNGTDKPETLDIFWAEKLAETGEECRGVRLARKVFLWEFPVTGFVVRPGCGKWVYFRREAGYEGVPGNIICLSNDDYLYCRLE